MKKPRGKKKRAYKRNTLKDIVAQEILANDVACIDSVPEGAYTSQESVPCKIEFGIFLDSMSKEARDFIKTVQNAPTEFLNSIFSSATKYHNKKYNRSKILTWLKKRYGARKATTITTELKNLYEYTL